MSLEPTKPGAALKGSAEPGAVNLPRSAQRARSGRTSGVRTARLAPGSVDAVGLEQRAAWLGARSIKRESKDEALRLAVRMLDLTTLEGSDTPGRVRLVARRAVRPDPSDPSVPSVAAVCVYPNLIGEVVRLLDGSGVAVASVATGFPAGQVPIKLKLQEVEAAIGAGATEIDMVIDRNALLSGRYERVVDEIAQVKAACGACELKVILESGELGSYDLLRRAALLAAAGGADFVKTSTGKLSQSATPPVVLCLLDAVREVYEQTGRRVGVKAAGGVRTAKQAVGLLILVAETLGEAWLTPDLFRIGASSLLTDILLQVERQRTGGYASADQFPDG